MAIAGKNVAARKDGAVFAHSAVSQMDHQVSAVIQDHKVVALRVWLKLLDNHNSGRVEILYYLRDILSWFCSIIHRLYYLITLLKLFFFDRLKIEKSLSMCHSQNNG